MNLIETTIIGSVSAIVGGAVAWMTKGKFTADRLQVKQAQAVLAVLRLLLRMEADVEVNSPQDAALADALIPLREEMSRENLAAFLDLTNPGLRDRPDFISRIKEVGGEQASRSLLERHGL